MKQRLPIAFTAAVLAVAVAVPALASGASGEASATANTIFMKDGKGGLRFEGPKTIVAGEELTVLNQTNPRQVGPHTFSLVTKGSLPKTAKARQLCFTPKHICMSIAKWHGVKGNGPVKVNPVEAGVAGWDTLGSVTKTGDSWFTGNKPKTSLTQPVSADTSAGPSRMYFLCAIHPWMQGSINVLPPPAG
ncbi:MAG TPA: hypothetical protein VIS51_03220 [Solirubrobacterales bacterium]